MAHITIAPAEVCCALDAGNKGGIPFASGHLQLLRLPHPRTGVPSLFLPHITNAAVSGRETSSSILEVQAIAPNSSRSWLLEGDQILADGKLLLMTPVDPVFLLIPILQAAQPLDGSIGNFRPADDIFEEAASKLTQGSAIKGQDVLRLATLDCVRGALNRICDSKEVTEELTVYRYSHSKLLQSISAKVARLSQSNVFDVYPSLQRQLAKDGLLDEGKGELRQAGRTRVACEMVSQYLPPDMTSKLIASHDFAALEAHIQALTDETNLPNPTCPTPTLKVNENEKKRKAVSQSSKGVSKLMKVNTTGMSKISTFFKKQAK
ncbi:ribonuclease H2, subunit B [Gautieria morchelliformis]|nr:ribonuclease H2, subunit B [Gautieria morchelliformis]